MKTIKHTSTRIFVVLLLACFLTACNLSTTAPAPIVVTVTPLEPLIVTATPLPLPPTPTPTPAPVPDVVLQTAESYLRNGEYENAIFTYQSLLERPAGMVVDDVRAAAAYGLGEAALRDGRFDDAVIALTTFLTEYSADTRTPWAYFLRGDALLGQGRWPEAIGDFQQYQALRPGVIDSYVYERIGDAQLAQADVVAAVASYEQAIQVGRGFVPLLVLREKVAQVYLNAGQPLAALTQYDAILDVAREDNYRAEIMFLAAQALAAGEDVDAAYDRYRQLITAYPETDFAYQAMRTLRDAGETIEPALWAQVSYAAADYQDAIAALHLATSEQSLSEIPPQTHLQLGRAYREVGNFDAAWTSFQTVIDLHPSSPEFGAALLEQGRTRFLSGDTVAAIERYLYLAETYPALPEAPEALWRVGYLRETLDQEAESIALYERLGRDYAGDEWAQDGLLRAATIALNQNDPATAERVLAALGATGTGEQAAAAYLWLGKLAQQNGNQSQAEAALQAATRADPGGYYSIRAEDLLLDRGIFSAPAEVQLEFNSQLELGQAEDWLRASFGITQTDALWPMSAGLAADPRVIAGHELWAVLAVDEAGEEFWDLLDEYEDDPLTSYQLAIWLRGIGAYPHSIVGAANIIKKANIHTLAAPPYLARMRYPVYYSNLVIPAMQEYGLNPLLLFALIRQESLFDRYATAAAGEKGLTQVIPATGEHIASRLSWQDYQHSDLFRPYASVAFGAYYLWEQLNMFDLNPVVGLAAYNAGPGNALSWLEESGPDPDMFVEAIGFDSTRAYVRRIYEHFHIYRTLYGGG